MGIMKGKKGIIMGLANDKSIAWGIAKTLADQGAEIALSYQGIALKKRVEPLAEILKSKYIYECDVACEESVQNLAKTIEADMGSIDFIVHSIAFADKNELRGYFYDTSRNNFLNSLDISCYSLISVIKNFAHIINPQGSILTLTYDGANKVVPNYNVMGVAKAALEASVRYLANDLGPQGVRINAISAGPIRTLAASGIGDFKKMLSYVEKVAPLRQNIDIWQVGNAALYLLSHLSSGTTGEIHYVDAGANIMAFSAEDISE